MAEQENNSKFNIQWYPGHMTKTRRQMEQDIKLVDLVAEIIDARIPISSRNPDIDAIVRDKPRLIVLNRADQADPEQNKLWAAYFKGQGHPVLETDAKTGKGVNRFSAVARECLAEQIARWKERGQVGRPVRAMVVGVPNVGKSTFIRWPGANPPRREIGRALPGASSGWRWTKVWICWTRRGFSGPNLKMKRPAFIWPLPERSRRRSWTSRLWPTT